MSVKRKRAGGSNSARINENVALACDDDLIEAMFVLGHPWTALIMHLLLQRIARYAELRRALPNITDRMLTQRLEQLRARRLIKRVVRPGPPVEVYYSLTALGRTIEEALEHVARWGARVARSR